jgi:hypothetical protein
VQDKKLRRRSALAFVAARLHGEIWVWSWSSLRLDPNALGLQRSQNLQEARGYIRYVRPDGGVDVQMLRAMVRGRRAGE